MPEKAKLKAAPGTPAAAETELPPQQAPHDNPFWEHLAQDARQELEVAGRILRPGSRVRLAPQPGGDLFDAALTGRTGIVDAIEEDEAGHPQLAVILEDDPGRGLGEVRHPAHRFFFAPDEVEPEDPALITDDRRRVLIAGIGNVFLGDDGFGVAVAQKLQYRDLPTCIEVIDFGIRGRDLVFQLGQDYGAAILVDAVPGNGHPGTLVIMQPELHDAATSFDGHRMDPATVLAMARHLGALPEQILIVGCRIDETTLDERQLTAMTLTAAVAAAVDQAADLVQQLALHLVGEPGPLAEPPAAQGGIT